MRLWAARSSSRSVRTTTAWIGTAVALALVAVSISTSAVMPGRTCGTLWSNTTLTSKFVCPSGTAEPPTPRFAVLPISVTVPGNDVSGSASTVILAFCPNFMSTTSLSSTSAFTSMRERSETVRIWVPGLFIVPMMTTSPCSTLRALTTPSKGATKRVLPRLSRAPCSAASERPTSSLALVAVACAVS